MKKVMCFLILAIVLLGSCTTYKQSSGCYVTRNMSGYK